MIRERLSGDLRTAIESEDADLVATLRLICAAIKDRDIMARKGDNVNGVTEAEIIAILEKMIHQREKSAEAYEESGRLDLAEHENAEISVIRSYMPRQLSDGEMKHAIGQAIETTGASSIRDISKVMAHLKKNHSGEMDFSRACASLKNAFR